MGGSNDPAEGAEPGGRAAEQALAATYRDVLGFVVSRASRGDATARHLAAGLHGYATMPPTRLAIRSWLADVASEARLIRPTSDPWTASRFRALMDAEEGRVHGAEDRVWREVVNGLRSGQGGR